MTDTLRVGRYRIDLTTGHVEDEGRVVDLSPAERRLLVELARRAPEAVPREDLIRRVWPEGLAAGSRALDQTWSRLRRRLRAGSEGRLQTVRGRGLVLAAGRPTQPQHSTPEFHTPFVGYADPLREVSRWCRESRSGWLTIKGIGGVGKTRLAAEVVRRLDAPDKVWVDLAPMEDGAPALLQIARRLGLDPPASTRIDDALARALAHRDVLLVLDNLEHVPTTCRRIGRAVAGAPAVRVLATSRRQLDVEGERVLELRGLDPSYGARELFEQLLRVGRVGEDITALMEPEVAHAVCDTTEGHPLTIELVVATLRRRPVSAMLRTLRSAPTRLRGERLGREPRHASFDATFEYSWHLLDEGAQQSLVALSLFAGPFDRTQAREILGVDPAAVETLLQRSLVSVDGDALRMHALVREAGRERLAELDVDGTRTRRFHRSLLSWLARAAEGIRTESAPVLIRRVEERLPDLTAAWRSAIAVGDEALIASAWPAARTWIACRDDSTTGVDWCGSALEVVADPDLRVDLLATLGHCLVPMGEARRALELMPTVTGEAAEPAVRMRLHAARAGAHARLGEGDLADRELELAGREADRLEDDDLTWLHLGRGMRLRAGGMSHLTGPDSEAALRHARASGNRPLLRRALVLHGSYLVARSRFAEALEHALEAGRLAEAAHDRTGLCSAQNIQALGLRYLGRLEEALAAFGASRAILTERGATANLPYLDNQVSNVLLELGHVDRALTAARRALQLAEEVGDRKDVSFILLTLANTNLAAGDFDAGRRAAERRRALEGHENPASACMTGIVLTLLAHLEGRDALAREELRRTIEHFDGEPPYLELHVGIAEALVEARAGDWQRAGRAARSALDLSRPAGQTTLRRSLYALALALAELGDGETAASVVQTLDAGPPLMERWIFGPHLERRLAGLEAPPPCRDAEEAAVRVATVFQA